MRNFDFEPNRDYLEAFFASYPLILDAWKRQDYHMVLAYTVLFSQTEHDFFSFKDADVYYEPPSLKKYQKMIEKFGEYGPGPEDEWHLTVHLVRGIVFNLLGEYAKAGAALREAIACSSTLSIEAYVLPVYEELAWGYLQGHLKYGSPELLYKAEETYQMAMDFAPFASTIRRGYLHVLMRLHDDQGLQGALLDYLEFVSDPDSLRQQVLHECVLFLHASLAKIDPLILNYVVDQKIRAEYRLSGEAVAMPLPRPSRARAHHHQEAYLNFDLRDLQKFSCQIGESLEWIFPPRQPFSVHAGLSSLESMDEKRTMPRLFELEAGSHDPEMMETYLQALASCGAKCPEAEGWIQQWLASDFLATANMPDLSGPWQELIMRPLQMLHKLFDLVFALGSPSFGICDSEDPLVLSMQDIASSARYALWTSELRNMCSTSHWPVIQRFQRMGYVLNAMFERRIFDLLHFRLAAFCLLQDPSSKAIERFEKQVWILRASADPVYRVHMQTFSSMYVLSRLLLLEPFPIDVPIVSQIRSLAMVLHHAVPQAPRAATWLLSWLNPNLEKYYAQAFNVDSLQCMDAIINVLLEHKRFDVIKSLYSNNIPEIGYLLPEIPEIFVQSMIDQLKNGAQKDFSSEDRMSKMYFSRHCLLTGFFRQVRLMELARLSRSDQLSGFIEYFFEMQDYFDNPPLNPPKKPRSAYEMLGIKLPSMTFQVIEHRLKKLFESAMQAIKHGTSTKLLNGFLFPMQVICSPAPLIWYRRFFDLFKQKDSLNVPLVTYRLSSHPLRSWIHVCMLLWSAPAIKPDLEALEKEAKSKNWTAVEGCLWAILAQVLHPELIYFLICVIQKQRVVFKKSREVKRLIAFLKQQFPTSHASQALASENASLLIMGELGFQGRRVEGLSPLPFNLLRS